jgi:hypothetical protein
MCAVWNGKQRSQAVESATLAVELAQKAIAEPQRSKSSSRDLRQRYAQAGLDTALKDRDAIERRGDLIVKFGEQTDDYQIAKSNAERHITLLRWML